MLVLFRKYPGTNKRQIVARVGLDLMEFKSGGSVHRKARISTQGSREVRKRLYEATLSAVRFNPRVRDVYLRLKGKGKPEKVARIAAARKLLLIAHAVYKNGERFHPSQEARS